MTRNGLRAHHRLLLAGTILAIVTLLATAGVAAGAQAAPSAETAAASTAVVQDDTETVPLEVEKEYNRSPENPDTVTVQYVVTNPEIVQRSDVDHVILDLSNLEMASEPYEVKSGLEHVKYDQYELIGSADQAVVEFENGLDSQIEQDGSLALVQPSNLRSCGTCLTQDIDVRPDAADGVDVDTRFTYKVDGQGFVTSGNSPEVSRLDSSNVESSPYQPAIVLGDFRNVTATEDGHEIKVVIPDGIELREDPQATADMLAAAAAEFGWGLTDGTHYAIAVPDMPGDNKGVATGSGSHWFQVKHTQPIHSVVNTWIHEYTHTTDSTTSIYGSTRFHEGYAVFRAQQHALEQGYGSFDEYRAYHEHSTNTDHVNKYHSRYHAAALALSVADYRMRDDSDGENTTDDLMRAIESYDTLSESEFDDELEEVGNESIKDMVRDLYQYESAPEPLTLDQYQDTYGSVPNLDTEVSSVTVTSNRGEQTVDTNGPLAVREGATVEFELTINNSGDASGHYQVEVRDRDPEPFTSPISKVHDDAHGEVGANSKTTVTLTHTFDEQGVHPIEVGRIVPDGDYGKERTLLANPHNVTVVPDDAAILRENGDDGQKNVDAAVTDATSTIVYQGDEFDEWLIDGRYSGYDTNEHGVKTFDPETWLDPGERDCIAFRYYGDFHCTASLEAVDDRIPTDPDNDGEYEDVTGDGTISQSDVSLFHSNRNESVITDYLAAYDFDDDGDIDEDDTNALFDEVVEG